MSHTMSIAKQDAAIKAEYDRIKANLAGISEEKLQAADSLIQRCAFMVITLQILEADVKAKGPVITFKNGKQTMRIENPSQKSYNTMINRYTAAMDKLLSLLPREAPPDPNAGDKDDGFDGFVANRGE